MKNLTDMTDEELALAYVNGNNRAFDMLLERNQSRLFSYILFVVRDRELANDLFQETFVKIITKLHAGKYTTTGKFGAWILRIAHNVMMDWYRRKCQSDRFARVEYRKSLCKRPSDERREEDHGSASPHTTRGRFHAVLSGNVV